MIYDFIFSIVLFITQLFTLTIRFDPCNVMITVYGATQVCITIIRSQNIHCFGSRPAVDGSLHIDVLDDVDRAPFHICLHQFDTCLPFTVSNMNAVL